MRTTPRKVFANRDLSYAQHISNDECRQEALLIPITQTAFTKLEETVARAIHAEHNRNEGQTTAWASLHRFQRVKYRCKAYSALVSIGLYRAT